MPSAQEEKEIVFKVMGDKNLNDEQRRKMMEEARLTNLDSKRLKLDAVVMVDKDGQIVRRANFLDLLLGL